MSNMLIVGLSGLGLLVALALAGVAFMKRRVPLVAWVFVPTLVLGAGAVGTWLGAAEVLAAIELAADDAVPGMARSGLWAAISADAASRWAAAALLALSAVLASLGAVAAGDDARLTPIAGAMAGASTLLGLVVTGAYAWAYADNITGAEWLLGILAVGGLGVTMGAFRRALDEQAPRVAAMRFASVVCMLLAVSAAGKAIVLDNDVSAFGAGGPVSSAATLSDALIAYADFSSPAFYVAWLAFAFALVIGFFGVFYELADVVQRRTVFDVAATVVVLTALGLIRVGEHNQTNSLLAVGAAWPAVAAFDQLGADLPPALLSIDRQTYESYPSDGGFGDVLMWKKLDPEDEEMQWVRAYRWTGTAWVEDGAPLSSVQALSARRPLIGAGGSVEASNLMQILERTADGRALLLMRGSEVRADTILPPTLAHLQVSFLELEIGQERDLQTDLWTRAGARILNFGPTAWYGEEEGEEPVIYFDAVAASSEASVLHVSVADERARVSDIVHSCLPWVMTETDDGVERSGRTCLLTNDTTHELRQAAAEVWPLPEAEHVRLTARRLSGGDEPAPELVIDRLQRELGGIDYCVGVLKDEGESEVGVLRMEVEVDPRGRLAGLTIHDRSRVQSQPIARCAALRFRHIEFDLPEPEEREEGAEAPPRPVYEINLDLLR